MLELQYGWFERLSAVLRLRFGFLVLRSVVLVPLFAYREYHL